MLSHLKGLHLFNSKLQTCCFGLRIAGVNILLQDQESNISSFTTTAASHHMLLRQGPNTISICPAARLLKSAKQQSLRIVDYPVAEFIIMSCHKNSHKYSSQIVSQN